jgi:very-short-patch-repair endonuclease
MGSESDIDPDISSRYRARDVDRLIARLAQAQHGVVSRAQLVHAGVGQGAVDHRVVTERLHVVHPGVYSAGHRALATDARRMAAVLAAGPGAVASHRTAGAIWELKSSEYLEVTAVSERRRPGIHVHRSRLPPDETRTVRGIPVTTVPRTLLDLATVLPHHQLERAVNEAEVRGLRDRLSLGDLVARYPGRRGTRPINSILERLRSGLTITHSELENRFLSFVRATGLPPPRVNANLHGFECDCVWPDRRLVVELDGHAVHGTTIGFERDRARDRALNADGWRTVRVTWRQLQLDAEALAADLTRILGAAASR